MDEAFIRAFVLWTACLHLNLVHVNGHAYVYWPTSRNYLKAPNDAQSNNRPGNGAGVNPASGLADYKSKWGACPPGNDKRPSLDTAWAWDLCGQSPNTFLQPPGASWKDWAGPPVATYKEGGNITFIVVVNAEHGGSHEFRLCPKKVDGSMSVREAAACIDSNLIARVPTPGKGCGWDGDACKTTTPHRSPSDPIYEHGPPRHLLHGSHVLTFQLPKGVSCEHCTVQWYWDTAFGEWFRGCMDIAIEAAPAPTPPADRRRGGVPPPPADRRRNSAPRRRSSRRRRPESRRRGGSRRRNARRRRGSSRRRSARRRTAGRRRSSSRGQAAPRKPASMEYGKVGCFPLAEGDGAGSLLELRDSASFTPRAFVRDPTCMEHKEGSVCRGGLPFFRLIVKKSNAVHLCLNFCASKGADFFGLLGLGEAEDSAQAECRCGATHTNYKFWKTNGLPTGDPHSSLILDLSTKLAECSHSSLHVYDYHGWKQAPASSGVPDEILDVSDGDKDYLKSVVLGRAS